MGDLLIAHLMLEKCPVCHFDVSAVTLRALRAGLTEHMNYHTAQLTDLPHA